MKKFFLFLLLSLLGLSHIISQKLIPVSTYIIKQKAFPFDLAINDEFAFIAMGEQGLNILNISNPKNIKQVSNFKESEVRAGKNIYGEANGVDINGSNIYLAYGNLGLKIIDFSIPEHPQKIGTYYKHQWVYSVDVSDNFAFLGLKSEGMHIVNIANPSDIELVSKKNVKDLFVKDISLAKGLYVIAVAEKKGLKIFNFKLPLSEFKPSGFPNDFRTNGSAEEIIVDERYAFLANGPGGISILDLNLPTYPDLVENIKTQNDATSVTTNEEYAIVANGSNLTIIDIYNPKAPFEVSSFEKTGHKFTKVRMNNDYVYAVFYNKKHVGLIIFQFI